MSDMELSGDGSGDEEIIYKCKHCPGKEFTAAERDNHRQLHKNEKKRGRPRRRQQLSPAPTNASIFDPVDVTSRNNNATSSASRSRTRQSASQSPRRSLRSSAAPTSPQPKKRKIIRVYQEPENVTRLRNDGG